MPTETSNYGLLKPLVNSATDQDLWGGYLNDDMDDIDGLFETAINWIPSSKVANFSVTAPTSGTTTTGSSNINYLCDATSGSITATLPAANTCSGMKVAFRKTDASANTITISSGTIDGSTTVVLTARYQYIVISSNGTSWNIESSSVTSFATPTVQRFLSGSGTYTTAAGVLYLKVTIVGGGGGGAGSANSGATQGSDGGDSSFASWVAKGGGGAPVPSTPGDSIGLGGTGGTGGASGTGNLILRCIGEDGEETVSNGAFSFAGSGGQTPLGGAGRGRNVATGQTAKTNSGSGGGGTFNIIGGGPSGGGGGAAEYVQFIVPNPSATYSYSVGAAGAGGTGSGSNAGAGAAGIVVVEEYHQ